MTNDYVIGPIITVYIFIGGLACGTACNYLAGEKGYSSCSAFIVGFFFNLLGLITYAGLPDKKSQDLLKLIETKLSSGINTSFKKSCSKCGEQLEVTARFCPRCGTIQ